VDLAEWFGSMAIVTAIVLGGLLLLPHGERRWLALVPGALVFALALRLLSLATSFYFAPKLGRVHDLYGSHGIAIVILLSLFLIARAWVVCQFLNATIAGVRVSPASAPAGGVGTP
jgi:uncharacterized BrkB/YihY/UPF0761 family membrane protein